MRVWQPQFPIVRRLDADRLGIQLVACGHEYVMNSGAAHRLLDRLEAVLVGVVAEQPSADPAAMKADRMQES